VAREVIVRIGRKPADAEQRAVDRSTMAIQHPLPPPPRGVDGQVPVYEAVQCPHCGAIGYAWIDDEYYTSIYCSHCHTCYF